jgi:hypothetical protein
VCALAAGWRDDEPYVELRIRPALHESLDRAGGLAEDSSIRVLDTRLRTRLFPEPGDVATDASVGVDQRLALSRRAALRADFAAHRYAGEAWIDAQIALQWTF